MQVFKAFFKIISKNLIEISIYIFVFLFFAVFLSSTGGVVQNTSFTPTKSDIAFINYDTDSRLVEGLKDYLNKNANVVVMENETEKLQDALFFREIEYIVRVPKGFTDALLSGKETRLEKTSVPDSTVGIYMDNMINKYLNTVKIYKNSLNNITQDRLVALIDKDLTNQTQVNVIGFNSKQATSDNFVFYFNYLAYSVFAILILGVCAVMLVFNNTDLKRRNLCSPIKIRNMNLQLVFGNLAFALITWFILISASFIIYGKYMFSVSGFLLLLNSLIFTVAALSISFLISNVVKSRGAMSAAANVVALGSSFISGVFVPQNMLSKSVLNIASFTPTYWYIKANNSIADITAFNPDNLMPIFSSMLIVLGFAIAVLAVTLVVIKQKRTSL